MFQLSDLAEILIRQFRRIALVGGLVALGAGYALLTTDPTYEARTVLLYKLGREYLYIPESPDLATGVRAPDPGDLEQIVGAEMQIVANREVRAQLLNDFGIDNIYPGLSAAPNSLEIALEALNDAIFVSLVPNTLMVNVRVRHSDPEVSADLANGLVDRYLERRAEVFERRDLASLERQLASAQTNARDIDDRISQMLDGSSVLLFDTRREILVQQKAALSTRIAQADAEIAGLEERRRMVETELDALPQTTVEYRLTERNPIVESTRANLVSLRAERDAAAQSLGEVHPTVRALERQIEALEGTIEAQPEEIEVGGRIGAHRVRQQAETDLFEVRGRLQELRAQRAHLVADLEANERALEHAASLMPQLTMLQQSAEIQRTEIAQLTTDLRFAMAEAGEAAAQRGSVRILERAQPPIRPIGASNKIRLLMALVLGGIVGLGVGVLGYLSRPTILSADMLARRIGAPVLAEVGRQRVKRSSPHYVG